MRGLGFKDFACVSEGFNDCSVFLASEGLVKRA